MSGAAPAQVPGSAPAAPAAASAAPAAAAAPSASAAMNSPSSAAPPAAAPAAGGNTSSPAAGASNVTTIADWLAGLDDAKRGFATNKGWKAPGDVLESYQNMEKLLGAPQDKIIRMPADDDKAGWDSVYSRLGRPAEAKDYGIAVDKEKGGDPAFAEWAGKTFHELGLSTKQGKELAGKFDAHVAEMKSAMDAQAQQRLVDGAAAVKKEWGAAYEQNVAVAKRGAAVMGIDKPMMDKIESAIGFDGVMKLFYNMGAKTGEASFVAGAQGDGALTPQAANDKINALKADPGWVKKYTAGDANARAEMQRLHQMAHPGESSL